MHTHNILKIIDQYHANDLNVYAIEMDCPVQPNKCVVVTKQLEEGEEFDPHFSNPDVIARFQPTPIGFVNAMYFVDSITRV